jgi:L-asparagine transporter-like permease
MRRSLIALFRFVSSGKSYLRSRSKPVSFVNWLNWLNWLLILIFQIIAHSTEKEYIIRNLPWLIGSLGTMVEDITIFVQFRIYARPALDS